MLFRVTCVAAWAVLATFTAADAQTARDFGGPREPPPAGFSGQQFVDSRGCVFLRAGYGGQINWVQRVGRDRKPLCGYPPTFGAKPVVEVAEAAPAPRPAPVPAGRKPIDTVASVTTPPTIRETPKGPRVDPATYAAPRPVNLPATGPARAAAPVVVAPVAAAAVPARPARRAPAGRAYETAAAGPGPGKIGCFAQVPVPQVVRLTNGGTAVVCTRGDGTMAGWRSPIYPAGSGAGPALTYPRVAETRHAGVAAVTPRARAVAPVAGNVPPKGYVNAWKDDRLNPYRAQGTVAGQAAQDGIWTREVPARLVAETGKTAGKKVVVVRRAAPDASLSTKSDPRVVVQPQTRKAAVAKATPAKPAAQGGAYVQVGTFGVPANADGAASRLSGLGLPVRKGNLNKNGKALQIVYAGPFGSAAEANAALGAARRAGFSDAFIR